MRAGAVIQMRERMHHLLEGVQFGSPLSRHGHIVWLNRVEHLLELLLILHEECVKALEGRQLGHPVDLLVNLSPLEVTQPVSRVLHDINGTGRSCKIVSPFVWIHRVASEEDLNCQNEGEEQFVSLEQTSADIIIEVECEVVIKMLDSLLCMGCLWRVVNTLSE